MKVKELRDKTIEELKKILNEERTRINQSRFDIKAKQVKDYRGIRNSKKDIARILTIIKEKEVSQKSK